MYKVIFSCIIGVLLLLTNSYAADIQNALNGKEIKQLVSGNTVEGHFTRPRQEKEYLTTVVKYKTHFSVNGEIVERSSSIAASSGSGNVAAHGSWFVKKGKLCKQFTDAKNNKKVCRKVIPTGDGAYGLYTGKGKLTRTWDRVIPGNPHNLR